MADRTVGEVYDDPGMEWWLRVSGPHFHGGAETATVALAERAAEYGFPAGGRIADVASALGAPARFLARRFGCIVVCIDMDRRMHKRAASAAGAEGLAGVIWPVLARTERWPLADAALQGAWSQDALCHMDKAPVLAEAARVIEPGGVFAFSDFIARAAIRDDDLAELRRLWAFPSLWTVARYVAELDAAGFEVLFAQDRTPAVSGSAVARRPDDGAWRERFVGRWGEAAAATLEETGAAWSELVRQALAGYGAFIARRRP